MECVCTIRQVKWRRNGFATRLRTGARQRALQWQKDASCRLREHVAVSENGPRVSANPSQSQPRQSACIARGTPERTNPLLSSHRWLRSWSCCKAASRQWICAGPGARLSRRLVASAFLLFWMFVTHICNGQKGFRVHKPVLGVDAGTFVRPVKGADLRPVLQTLPLLPTSRRRVGKGKYRAPPHFLLLWVV